MVTSVSWSLPQPQAVKNRKASTIINMTRHFTVSPSIRSLLVIKGDKNSLFWGWNIAETGLGVEENVITGYWGCDKGPQYGWSNVGHGPMYWGIGALLWRRLPAHDYHQISHSWLNNPWVILNSWIFSGYKWYLLESSKILSHQKPVICLRFLMWTFKRWTKPRMLATAIYGDWSVSNSLSNRST